MTSTRAHANILSVDISEASKQLGFVDYISKNDVKGSNLYNIMGDDEVFADGKVLTLWLFFMFRFVILIKKSETSKYYKGLFSFVDNISNKNCVFRCTRIFKM